MVFFCTFCVLYLLHDTCAEGIVPVLVFVSLFSFDLKKQLLHTKSEPKPNQARGETVNSFEFYFVVFLCVQTPENVMIIFVFLINVQKVLGVGSPNLGEAMRGW